MRFLQKENSQHISFSKKHNVPIEGKTTGRTKGNFQKPSYSFSASRLDKRFEKRLLTRGLTANIYRTNWNMKEEMRCCIIGIIGIEIKKAHYYF